MRTLTLLKTSLATAALLTSGVAAGTTAVAAPAPAENSVSAICHATAIYGNTPIYASKSHLSTVVGHLIEGVAADSGCNYTTGSVVYDSCGYKSNTWVWITGRGYVKWVCVMLAIEA